MTNSNINIHLVGILDGKFTCRTYIVDVNTAISQLVTIWIAAANGRTPTTEAMGTAGSVACIHTGSCACAPEILVNV